MTTKTMLLVTVLPLFASAFVRYHAGRGMRLEAVMIEELKAYSKPTITAADNIVPF